MFKQLTVAAAALLLAGVAFGQSELKGAVVAAPSSDLFTANGKGGYSVEFVNAGNVAGVQFDIQDSGIKAGGYTCGGSLSSAFQSSCTLHAEEGFLRVIVFSMDNAAIPDATLVNISSASAGNGKYKAEATKRPSINGVIFSDNQGRNVTPDHLD